MKVRRLLSAKERQRRISEGLRLAWAWRKKMKPRRMEASR